MNPEKRNSIILIILGLLIPSVFLGATMPGGYNYTDSGGLSSALPWLFFVAPPSAVVLVLGIYRLIKSQTNRH